MQNVIKKKCKIESLSYKQIAQELGVSKSYIQKMANGNLSISENIKLKIKESFGNLFTDKTVKLIEPLRSKNLNCRNKCYHMKVQNRHLRKARPMCPICKGKMYTKEEKKTMWEVKDD